MKRLVIPTALLCAVCAMATEFTWHGYTGAASTAPRVTVMQDAACGEAVKVEAVADGAWQGAEMRFHPAVNLDDYEGVEFQFSHNITSGRTGLVLRVEQTPAALIGKTVVATRGWSRVFLPFTPEGFRSAADKPLPFGKATAIRISPYGAMKTKGCFLAFAQVRLIPKKTAAAAAPPPSAYTGTITVVGYKGAATAPPKVTEHQDEVRGAYHHVEAVDKGNYQALQMNFTPPADLGTSAGLEFWLRHNVVAGKASFVVHFVDGRRQMHTVVQGVPARQWHLVFIPFEADNFTASTGNAPAFGACGEIRIAPYAALNAPGKFLDLAGVRLVPKAETSRPHRLPVSSYRHLAPPTSGDDSGRALVDGDTKANVFFREYSADPDLVFDLGAPYALDELAVDAFAAPSHNFDTIVVYSSYDGKSWTPAGVLKNPHSGVTPQPMHCSFKPGRAVVGRYFRLQATRRSTDYKTNLSEVAFTGHAPSAKEVAEAAATHYDLGPAMPPRNAEDYHEVKHGAWRFYVSKANGVINGLYYRDRLLFERIAPQYTLQTRAKDIPASGYQDAVRKSMPAEGGITMVLENPALPGVTIERTWQTDGNALVEKVAILYHGKERFFLRVATEAVLEQNYRRDGFYEMPSSALAAHMYRLPASEVRMERALTNIPMLAFDHGKTRQVIWHYRHRYNGHFTYFDAGAEEENLQLFKPNGWLVTAGTFVPADAPRQTLENRLVITDGGMLKAYDEYLDLPEVAAFRRQIRRPKWVRDMRLIVAFGWDGNYPASSRRLMQNYQAAFSRRGYWYDGELIDADGIWGDLVIKGPVRGSFGDCRDASVLQKRMQDIHRTDSRFKVGIYTWMMSNFPWSTPVKNHPEWFIRKLRNGADASWFPGVNTNYLRFYGIPASRDEAVRQIGDFVRYYGQCGWYLDGGKSGTYAKDWETMRIDPPYALTDFYLQARREVQRDDPERCISFNHSGNPIGDIGQLENSGGVLTGEWRRGAILMWKFKMYSHRDPLHQSVYTYWLPAIDGIFHNYMAGTGVTGNLNSHHFHTRDLPFLGARYDIRIAVPVDAAVSPDWRYDTAEELECNTLRQLNNGWIFMQYHGDRPALREVSAALAPLGMTATSRPVHAWLYTIRDAKAYNALYGEPQLAKAYRETGWIGERAVTCQYLGAFPWQERLAWKIPQQKNQAQVLMLSQVPAVVLSMEDDPAHYLLAGQPGITIAESDGGFLVDSEYTHAEVGLMLPPGRQAVSVTVDGKVVPHRLHIDRNQRYAVVQVGQGKSRLAVQTRAGAEPEATALAVARQGRKLSVQVTPANAPVQIYADGALALSRTGSFELELPETVRDGRYEVVSGRQRQFVELKGLGRPLVFQPLLVSLPIRRARTAVNRTVRGIPVLSAATAYTEGCCHAAVAADRLAVTAGTIPYYESHYNEGSAALEVRVKRFVRMRIRNGLIHHTRFSYQPGRHFVRYGDPACFAGLMLDFGTLSGYSVRSAAGFGVQTEKRREAKRKSPEGWGTCREPQHVYALTRTLFETKNDIEELWLDLKQLGAPANWDGRLWLAIHTQNFSPDRTLQVEVLETTDSLPDGVQPKAPIELGGKLENTIYRLHPCHGAPDWNAIPALGELVPADATSIPLKTVVKAACDDANLYFRYECHDNPGHILVSEGSKSGKPWEGDGVEFFVRLTNDQARALHVIMDASGAFFLENVGMVAKRGEKRVVLENGGVTGTATRTPYGWCATVTLPWRLIGGRPAGGAIPFNLMRNRPEGSHSSYYTLSRDGNYFSNLLCQLQLP